ncbi:MAG: IclR family transcriptional regulator [Paracoccaceae bacterium]
MHALRVLRHLCAQGTPQGVSAIARATGVNGSTCFNLLRTMSAEGLVVFDTEAKTYRPGLGLVELAIGVMAMNPADLIRPELERLALHHGALICLWHVSDIERIVLIDSAFDPTSVRIHLPQGKRQPALIGSVGRVIAARLGLSDDELRTRFARFRWESPPLFDDYLADVRRAAIDGYAFDCGQLYIGVDVVASVICDHRGMPRYGISSITLAGQTDDTARHSAGRDLAETCARLGHALFSTLPDQIRARTPVSAS